MNLDYLCYDLRGIQSYIFAVPKLRYIVGGSSVIDRFDREIAPGIGTDSADVEFIAAGGGRGMYRCRNEEAASSLVAKLRREASRRGLDLWIGRGPGFQAAAPTAEALYAFLPELGGAHPCPVSGLYPTGDPDRPSRLIRERLEERDRLEDWMIREIKPRLEATPDFMDLRGLELAVPRDVSGADPDSRAQAGAFGGSGRWALLAMDGNDIGRQHAFMAPRAADDPEGYASWLAAMSTSLDECTRESFLSALLSVMKMWIVDQDPGRESPNWGMAVAGRKAYLPVRPLILGGDDLVCLVHPRFALEFARVLSRSFADLSQQLDRQSDVDLWPATGGRLSISAGLLYARTTYPLHAGIRYAEELLSSAKQAFRQGAGEGNPAPAAIDWESVTEGMVDSPADRRLRDLIFNDHDTGDQVSLTSKPYSFEDLEALSARFDFGGIPRSVLTGLRSGMRAPYWDRFAYRARIGRRHPGLAEWLAEDPKPGGNHGPGWRVAQPQEGPSRRNLVLMDLLSLQEEGRRARRQKAGRA